MPTRRLTIEEIRAILPETPRRIAELTKSLKPAQLHQRPGPDSWSINDVLAHLRACEDILGGAILRILREDHPTWKAMNPRTWQAQTDYHEWKFERAFTAFRKQRRELLAAIDGLRERDWARTATVIVWTARYERSVHYYAAWLAQHERTHWRHIERIAEAVRSSRRSRT